MALEDVPVRRLQGGAVLEVVAGGEIRINGGIITNAGTQASAIAAITDSTGGTPSTTAASIAAGAGYTQADMVAVKNAISSILVELNAVIAAIHGAGISA